jgi:hypothetical protein
MLILPGAALAVSLALAYVTLRRYVARRRTHELVWSATFASFALAAGCEILGGLVGWTPLMARLYYLSGATMSVGYLAVGTLYLLAPRQIATAGLIVTLVQTTAAVVLVWRAQVDVESLATAGWSALEKRGELIALAITINTLGTVIVVGGALASAWLLWQGRGMVERGAGVALIGLGTLVVALGGTLTRLGRHEYLYAAMVPGLLLIFGGYLLANVRHRSPGSPPIDQSAPHETVPSPP